MRFVKMHGLGNDYVYVDCFRQAPPADPAALARAVAHRRFGVGSDGLILVLPSETADARMRIFNADGSEGRMCGNGIRCVGKLLWDSGLCRRERMTIETRAGVRALEMRIEDGKAVGARVEMGVPALAGEILPARPTGMEETAPTVLRLAAGGGEWDFVCLIIGNAHAASFAGIPEDAVFRAAGPLLERADGFPEGVNVEWNEILSRRGLRMRVWERGSGETMACGTGATASAVAAILLGLCDSPVRVEMGPGALTIEWAGPGEPAYMTGPAEMVFTGVWPDE